MEGSNVKLRRATDRLVKEILKVNVGESVVITGDTSSNLQVVQSTAASVFACGGKPLVVLMSHSENDTSVKEAFMPVEVLGAMLTQADVWIECNHLSLLNSKPFEIAYENNKYLRYLCMTDMQEDVLIRHVSDVDLKLLSEIFKTFIEMNESVDRYRVKTKLGTDVTFKTNLRHLVSGYDGDSSKPGVHMMLGQLNIVPEFGSANGTIVLDGSVIPCLGILEDLITLTLIEGRIVNISGGHQAETFEAWLDSFEDCNMRKLSYVSYGLNPGAELSGNIVEDQRIWGSVNFSFGFVSEYSAPPFGQYAMAQADGGCLNATVYLDDEMVMEDGHFVHSKLKNLEKKILRRKEI